MLIQWLRNRRWKRRRLIFHYHDGIRVRAADPIEVAVAIHAHPEFLYRHLRETAEGDHVSQSIVARTACDVFDVSPLEVNGREGLTVAERVELMMAFDLYLIALKKNIEPSRTPQFSTASTFKPSHETATSSTSPSGSTEIDPPSEPPASIAPESSPAKANSDSVGS